MKPPKVHDETWQSVERQGGFRLYSDNAEEEWATVWGDDNRLRARLAACAPELARMLRSLFVIGVTDDQGCYCWSCKTEARYEDSGYVWDDHKPDCALALLLRKAGVLE